VRETFTHLQTPAGLTMGVLEWYDHLMVDLRDPRVDNWLGMASIWPTIIICTVYVYFVKVVGPRLMKDREPYELKNILLVYNFSQVLFSFWMFMEGWGFYISGNYSWHCEPVDYSESPVARRALNLAWWYYFSKFIDLFDSFFFVLKKKFAHLSPLHVIHHSTLPFLCWWGPRFVGGGQSGFGPFLNSGVHTLMYLYYLLAACGPSLKPYLWWKKYLTTIQLVQFVLVFFHALQPLIFTCDYPVAASLMFAVTGVQYFILFMAFYRQAYSKKKSIVKVDKNGNSDVSNGQAATGNGELANGHTVLLASNGTDLRQRKLA
jgi:hypothetical protein